MISSPKVPSTQKRNLSFFQVLSFFDVHFNLTSHGFNLIWNPTTFLLPHHFSGTPPLFWYPITFLKPHHFSGIPSLFWNPITFLESHHFSGIPSLFWNPITFLGSHHLSGIPPQYPTPTILPSVATPVLTIVVPSGL